MTCSFHIWIYRTPTHPGRRNPQVLASYGHVRDLPPKQGSVRPEEGFAMDWQLLPRASGRMKDLQVGSP